MAELNVDMGPGCGRTPPESYLSVIKNTQLISVDLLVKCNGKYLLGKRNNNPARGFWFVPGSRVYKGESLATAVSRVMNSELGLTNYTDCQLLGVYDHCYRTNFANTEFGTEYIVFAHMLDITEDEAKKIVTDDQHEEMAWFSESEILERADVHVNNKRYFQDSPDNILLRNKNSH